MECDFKRKFQLNMDGILAGANYNYNAKKIRIFVTFTNFHEFNLSHCDVAKLKHYTHCQFDMYFCDETLTLDLLRKN